MLVMSMIFPGMDPYLEDPQLWPSIHSRLIVYLADSLELQLGPRYTASLEERVYVEGPDHTISPDVWIKKRPSVGPNGGVAVLEPEAPVEYVAHVGEVHESFVAILDRQTKERIVTVIEVVSPTNKYAGPGRDSYVTKQREVLASQAHLIEIDLLRKGPHVLAVPEIARDQYPCDYLISINRAVGRRARFQFYPKRLCDRLPRIAIPLAEPDTDGVLELQALLEKTYEAGGYRRRLRYERPCSPPLSPEDQAWADELIRQAAATKDPSTA
jgi:hypothetical protein